MNLYEIDQAILACVDMETGEIVDPEKLDALQLERDAKIEGVGLWVKNLKAEAAALKAEKEAFAKRQQEAEKLVKSLQNWLTRATGGEAWKSTKVTISYRASTAVEIAEDAKIPKKYYRMVEPEVDKLAIRAALEEGKKIAGCAIVRRSNIQVR